MATNLKNISSNRDLTFFRNEKNIPNQELVKETIEYFESGKRNSFFKPLEFLNLLWKQYTFVKDNYKESEKVILHLNGLPLTKLQKHILFGIIIKWFGGYPFNRGTDFDENWLATKKAIEQEFLNYPEETPEKEFCKADSEKRKKLRGLGIALSIGINHGVDAGQIYSAIVEDQAKKKYYSSFDELFEDAVQNGIFGEFNSRLSYFTKQGLCNFNFHNWLFEKKGLEDINGKQYQTFLTKETFLEYLNYENEQDRQRASETEKEKESWRIITGQKINHQPKTFEMMFEYPILIESCINALREVSPPIITKSDAFNLGSRSKGSMVAWVTALKTKGIIKNNLQDSIIVKLLNERFKGLNLGADGRTLRNTNTTTYRKYYTKLLNLLPVLPLSTGGRTR